MLKGKTNKTFEIETSGLDLTDSLLITGRAQMSHLVAETDNGFGGAFRVFIRHDLDTALASDATERCLTADIKTNDRHFQFLYNYNLKAFR